MRRVAVAMSFQFFGGVDSTFAAERSAEEPEDNGG